MQLYGRIGFADEYRPLGDDKLAIVVSRHQGKLRPTRLLPSFDGVAVLAPDYIRDVPSFTDPTPAQPLADQGLLHRLSPGTFVDQQTAEAPRDYLAVSSTTHGDNSDSGVGLYVDEIPRCGAVGVRLIQP